MRTGYTIRPTHLNRFPLSLLPVITLSNIPPLGSGEDRVVYPHPERPDLCIKIPQRSLDNLNIKGMRDTIFYLSRICRKESLDYNFVDVRYAERLERRKDGNMFQHIPRCYGFVETDLGVGVVWQRIQDFDGKPCTTLKDIKHRGQPLTAEERDKLWMALQAFFSWQLDHGIMLREMAYTNIMICRLNENEIRLYHIDAIGCADLIPFADYATWFAKLRVLSKVSRFRKRMIEWLGAPPTASQRAERKARSAAKSFDFEQVEGTE